MTRNLKLITAAIGALAFLFAFQVSVFAAKNSDIPEKNGVYDVPGHPNLKVRVFVYNPKKELAQNTWPNCTDDLDSSAIVDPTGWHLASGTWNYVINSASVPSSIGSGNLKTIAANAFGKWQSTQAQVKFNQSADLKITGKKLDGKNIVTFGRASGSALAITYTWYNTRTKVVVENDTIFNLKYPWFWNQCNSNAYDAQGILTHELGHWMGLNDEYTDSYIWNTMYGYGDLGETKDMTLATGDVQGVKAIY